MRKDLIATIESELKRINAKTKNTELHLRMVGANGTKNDRKRVELPDGRVEHVPSEELELIIKRKDGEEIYGNLYHLPNTPELLTLSLTIHEDLVMPTQTHELYNLLMTLDPLVKLGIQANTAKGEIEIMAVETCIPVDCLSILELYLEQLFLSKDYVKEALISKGGIDFWDLRS